MKNNSSEITKDISWNKLKTATRSMLDPFQLELQSSGDILYCNEIVRVMPGKRMVAFATWGEKSVVAKLFYEPRHAQRHVQRDAMGVKGLLSSGVLAPQIYFQGRSKDRRIFVLIFERVQGQSLDTLWQEKNSIEEVTTLMHAVIIELATLHVLGILQHDLHFKNFIVRKKQIYMLDGGDVDIEIRPLTKKESLNNLGLFFAQFGVGAENLQRQLFQTYVRSRGWLVKDRDISMLRERMHFWQQKRLADFRKKLSRSCSAFVKQESYSHLVMYDREYESAEFLACLKNPEVVFSADDTEILKQGRSATIAKVYIDGRAMVVKRYNMKNRMHWLRRCLRPTRAATSWRFSQTLRLMGIATPASAAFIENHFLGLRGSSYLLMENIHGKHLGEYIANRLTDVDAILVIAKKVITLIENLAKLKITHGDLKMTNILIENDKPYLIDLDGMCEHSSQWRFKRTLRRELDRFMLNWRDLPAVSDIFGQLIKGMNERLGV